MNLFRHQFSYGYCTFHIARMFGGNFGAAMKKLSLHIRHLKGGMPLVLMWSEDHRFSRHYEVVIPDLIEIGFRTAGGIAEQRGKLTQRELLPYFSGVPSTPATVMILPPRRDAASRIVTATFFFRK